MDGMKILLIEDSVDLVYVLKLYLSMRFDLANDTIDAASNTEDALTCINNSIPDVILIDYYLEDGPATRLLNHCRTRLPDTPVILLTAKAFSSEELKNLPCSAVLTKPFDLTDLEKLLSQYIVVKNQYKTV